MARLPPKRTDYDYLDLWDADGTLDRIHARTSLPS